MANLQVCHQHEVLTAPLGGQLPHQLESSQLCQALAYTQHVLLDHGRRWSHTLWVWDWNRKQNTALTCNFPPHPWTHKEPHKDSKEQRNAS